MSGSNNNIDIETLEAMDMIRKRNAEYFEKTGKKRLSLTRTYGCQMNILRPI